MTMRVKAFLIFLFPFFFISSAFADNLVKAGPPEKIFSTSLDKHTAVIKVKYRPFDREKYGIASSVFFKKKKLIGTDYDVPDREFEYFNVSLNGKKIVVDKKWYADLYNPNFADGFLSAAIGDDLKSVLVFMNGSSAAGHYDVLWVFREDGHHSRFVTDVSDMSLFSPDIGGVLKETGRYLVK